MEDKLDHQKTNFQKKLSTKKAYQQKLTKFYQGEAWKLDSENKKLKQENRAHKDGVQAVNKEKLRVEKLFQENISYIKVIYPQKTAPGNA